MMKIIEEEECRMMKELEELMGPSWVKKYWTLVDKLIVDIGVARNYGVDFWTELFGKNDWSFEGKDLGIFGWEVMCWNKEKIVRIENERITLGKFDENGDITWIKEIPLKNQKIYKGEER